MMSIPGRCLVVLLVALAPAAGQSIAGEYWVEPPPAGNDGNPGTDPLPWATLQHAADEVVAGDTVWVRSGSYAGAHLTTTGTASLPIAFRAAPGEAPQITADNPTTPDGFNIEGANWVTIEGFQVTGRTRAGIRAVLCEHVTIRNNVCDANGTWGVFTGFCDDLLIENNTTSQSGDEHGIYVSNSGDRPVIRGNRSWGNNACGIHMNGDASMGGDGIISQAVVEENTIWGNGDGGGSGINMDGVQDSLVRNNLIYDQHSSGISMYRIDGGGSSSNNRLLNNTVIVASDGRWALNIQDDSTGSEIRNNVLWSEQGFRGAMSVCSGCLAGFTSNHNAVEDRFTLDDGSTVLTLAEWRSATGQDAASMVATPGELFVDPPGGDHHLKPGSPALDTGELRPDVPTDLEGNSRPIGPTHDIGAYEGVAVIFVDNFESGHTGAWASSTATR